MIWNKKKDGRRPGCGNACGTDNQGPGAVFAEELEMARAGGLCGDCGRCVFAQAQERNHHSRGPSYLEASPEVRDVSNTLSGTGTLNPANTYTVKSLVEGKVLTGEFEEGDVLDEGSILYTLDSSDASTNFEKAEIAMQQAQRSYDKVVDRQYVRAEVDGTVSTLKVAKGDEVTSGQEVAIIRDSSKMLLTLEFPAADAADFSVGQTAQVTLDGTFEQWTAP